MASRQEPPKPFLASPNLTGFQNLFAKPTESFGAKPAPPAQKGSSRPVAPRAWTAEGGARPVPANVTAVIGSSNLGRPGSDVGSSRAKALQRQYAGVTVVQRPFSSEARASSSGKQWRQRAWQSSATTSSIAASLAKADASQPPSQQLGLAAARLRIAQSPTIPLEQRVAAAPRFVQHCGFAPIGGLKTPDAPWQLGGLAARQRFSDQNLRQPPPNLMTGDSVSAALKTFMNSREGSSASTPRRSPTGKARFEKSLRQRGSKVKRMTLEGLPLGGEDMDDSGEDYNSSEEDEPQRFARTLESLLSQRQEKGMGRARSMSTGTRIKFKAELSIPSSTATTPRTPHTPSTAQLRRGKYINKFNEHYKKIAQDATEQEDEDEELAKAKKKAKARSASFKQRKIHDLHAMSRAAKIFRSLDVDGDGELSKRELAQGLLDAKILGKGDFGVNQLFELMGGDDGFITFEEFSAHVGQYLDLNMAEAKSKSTTTDMAEKSVNQKKAETYKRLNPSFHGRPLDLQDLMLLKRTFHSTFAHGGELLTAQAFGRRVLQIAPHFEGHCEELFWMVINSVDGTINFGKLIREMFCPGALPSEIIGLMMQTWPAFKKGVQQGSRGALSIIFDLFTVHPDITKGPGMDHRQLGKALRAMGHDRPTAQLLVEHAIPDTGNLVNPTLIRFTYFHRWYKKELEFFKQKDSNVQKIHVTDAVTKLWGPVTEIQQKFTNDDPSVVDNQQIKAKDEQS